MWLEGLQQAYTASALAITIFSGLLTLMVERFLYARRGYKREAAVTAFFGWLYVGGGPLLYLVLSLLKAMG
ncbi:MAG TPA: CLC_0170 family protein [Symbiobacteriaceae bacterium]|nr:CLC_0170 family protein [Symbiobacteriaceae bacterium]